MKKRIITILAMALALVFMFSSFAFANTTSKKVVKLSPDIIKQLKENAANDGIDEATQDRLIKKLENGEILDCMDSIKIAEALKYLKVTKDNPRAEYTFADGSKYVLEIKVADTNAISPASANTRDVNVKAGSFLYNANFWSNITTGVSPNTVNSTGAWYIYNAFYPYSQVSCGVTKRNADSNGPATAKLSWILTVNNYQYNNYLQINVQNDEYWVTKQM